MSNIDRVIDTPVVTIAIHIGQLELLQRAAKFAIAEEEFTKDTAELLVLEHLIECMQDTIDRPTDYVDGQHVTHGYAL